MLLELAFKEIVREEALFCNILSHLLLTRGPNLRNFISLIEKGLPIAKQIEAADLERAQLFSEFSFLRDYWYSLGKNNAAKRDLCNLRDDYTRFISPQWTDFMA